MEAQNVKSEITHSPRSDHNMDEERRSSIAAGLDVVGQDTKVLIEMLTNLDHLGIDATNEVHLPKIVVVGDQSAGKSSLIEAISEIRVPRSSGTCTRCPLQISLMNDDKSWSCKVRLQKLYDYDAKHCDPESPFYPWLEKSNPTIVQFSEVTNKSDLEETLIRAQVAILNPGIDPSNFLTLPIAEVENPANLEVKFSPNIICLDIHAPNVPSLSFYDLPGIINQTEDADEVHLVSLVENLAEKYVKDKDSLILLTCSLEGDIANSSAARLVRKFRAVDRCIGVLTKPDRFPSGEDVDIIGDMLEGKKYQVGHGYFITKQPGQADLVTMEHSQARKLEKEFFRSHETWNSPRLTAFKNRMGTEKLQAALSQKLAALVVGRFSIIKDTVREKREEFERQLEAIPQPINREESHTRVNFILLNFSQDLEKHMKGEDPEFCGFLYDFKHRILKRLREGLLAMKPRFIYSAKALAAAKSPEPSHRQSGPDFASSPKKRKYDGQQGPGMAAPPADFMAEFETPGTLPREALRFTAEDIKNQLSKFSVDSGVGSEDNPRALDHLRLQSLNGIHIPTSKFIKETKKLMQLYTTRSLESTMQDWKGSLLYTEIVAVLSTVFEKEMERQVTQADHELTLERMKPMTYTDDWLRSLEEEEIKNLEESRHAFRVKSHLLKIHGAEKCQSLSSREIEAKYRDEKLRAELGPDPHKNIIRVVAKVKAYYILATNRLIDYLARHMHLELFEMFRNGLFYMKLMEIVHPSAGEDVPTRCAILLADDGERETRRRILRHQKDSMDEAWRYLQEAEEKFK